MQTIELQGEPSETYRALKEDIQDFLLLNKIEVKIKEHNVAEQSSYIVNKDTTLIFRGHNLTFKNTADIKVKLPKLYKLLKLDPSEIQSEKGSCINCDHCKCKKKSNNRSIGL